MSKLIDEQKETNKKLDITNNELKKTNKELRETKLELIKN